MKTLYKIGASQDRACPEGEDHGVNMLKLLASHFRRF